MGVGVGGRRVHAHFFQSIFLFFDLLVLRGYCSNHLLSACTEQARHLYCPYNQKCSSVKANGIR